VPRRRARALHLDFGDIPSEEPPRRSRVSALTVGFALAIVIHFGALAALLSSARLEPVRERLIRVVLYAEQNESVPAVQPPAPVAASAPKPARAVPRPPRPAPIARASEPAPEPSPSAPVEDATAQPAVLASASVPIAREPSIARPRYKRNPEPTYPALARRRRQEGVVLLAVLVDAAGRPETIEVQASSGFASLDEAAVAAVRDWEFEPGRQDGEPVASRVEVPIQFQLARP
jgi:periplasmic protein TonB